MTTFLSLLLSGFLEINCYFNKNVMFMLLFLLRERERERQRERQRERETERGSENKRIKELRFSSERHGKR